MSKFTSQEVEALQEGGNQRARETFLRDWDPREQRLPDNSNVEKLREFIKSVYVDKKFFSSKASGKPPRDTLNHRNHEDETRRASSYHSYSQSPPYDYQYEERRYGKQAPALTKKPGSDRGMFRFLSTSRLSDHVQEDRFANEVPNARVSDYSATSGGDLFGSPSSETSRDIITEDVQQSSESTFVHPKAKQDPDPATINPQKTCSSGNLSQLGSGLDLFSAPQSTISAAPSVEPGKFGGLDLFSAPYAPQLTTPAPSAVDLFDLSATSSASVAPTSSVNQQFQAFEPSFDLFSVMPHQQSAETVKDKLPDMITEKNEGWATFDMPWHAEPNEGIKSSTVVSETSTSDKSLDKFDQTLSLDKTSNWSFNQDFNATGPSSLMNNPWHNIGAPVDAKNHESWSSFEEPTPLEIIHTKSSKQIPVQDSLVADDPYMAWGIPENLKMKQADLDTTRSAPFLSTTPFAIGLLDSSSVLPVDGAQSRGLDTKSRNPFDFPSDGDLESSNMFFDMSSLQAGLPSHNMSTTPWFPESAAIPYTPGQSQDALVFIAGQGPSLQIPNIQAQGSVASIGGNPFG